MFDFFSGTKRSAGIDIKADCIRFLELETKNGLDRITAYGEVTFEGSDPDAGKLSEYLRDIKKSLRSKIINVAIPVGSDSAMCEEILKSAGIKASKIISPAEPLELACIPERAETSFLIVDAENLQTHYLLFAPNSEVKFYATDSANHSIISNLNRLYIDWYDRHKERVHHVLISGAKASDQEFLDYISRETKIPIAQANIFTNLKLDHANVPMIGKNDSYKYAVAIGLSMM